MRAAENPGRFNPYESGREPGALHSSYTRCPPNWGTFTVRHRGDWSSCQEARQRMIRVNPEMRGGL